MNTLIIYDTEGTIFYQASGSYSVPSGGVLFLELEIEVGKYVEKVDTTQNPHEPILADLPKSTVALLQEKVSQAEADNLTSLQALADLYEMIVPLLA